MNKIVYIPICFLSLGTAFLYFAYSQQWIIIHIPSRSPSPALHSKTMTKKNVQRIYWHNGTWHHEQAELLWSENPAEQLSTLITSWLNLLDEEEIMPKKVSLQSIILSPSGNDAYCSFDRNPFTKEQSTFEKLYWIEGLLKTIHENHIKIQSIYFLVHHALLNDYHLDFSNPWPLSGFIEKLQD